MAPHHNEDLLLGHASVPREGLLAGEDHLAPEADPDRPGRPTEFCLDVLVPVQRVQRAVEQIRTTDLLITSDRSGVAGGFRNLQDPHSEAGFSSALCCVLHRIAFRWYQSGVRISRLAHIESLGPYLQASR